MIRQKHLSLALTLRCNLKCKLCSAGSPYYDNPTLYSAETLNRSIDEYFKIAASVEKLTLTGGEPLLSKALPEIVAHLEQYLPRIHAPEIITNGTIEPSRELLEILRSIGKFAVLVDNYGKNISRKAKDVKKAFDSYAIACSERVYYGENAHCGGWVDFRDLSIRGTNPAETFSKCAYPQKMGYCFTMVGGKIFPCSATRRCIEQGVIPFEEAEYLDVFDAATTYAEKEKWFTDLESAKYLKACARCPGLTDEAERFAPAEQMEKPIKSGYIW
jgi:hypothetical protein